RDLDAGSAALWLEQVPARRVAWDLRRHARAAYLLGRLAASRAVAPLATAVHGARTPRVYAHAWPGHIVLPVLARLGCCAHPPAIHAEGGSAGLAHIRRPHAALLTVFSALPSLPVEHLDDEPTPRLRRLFRSRAAIARFALDLLEDTRPTASARPSAATPP